jgi:hypothetical protein
MVGALQMEFARFPQALDSRSLDGGAGIDSLQSISRCHGGA